MIMFFYQKWLCLSIHDTYGKTWTEKTNVGQISQKSRNCFYQKNTKIKKNDKLFFYEKDHYTLKIYKYKNKYFFSFWKKIQTQTFFYFRNLFFVNFYFSKFLFWNLENSFWNCFKKYLKLGDFPVLIHGYKYL